MLPSWVRWMKVIALLFVATPSAWGAIERPVIVIPGILGSKLCSSQTGEVVWGGLQSLLNLQRLALPMGATDSRGPMRVCGLLEAIEVVGPFKVRQYDRLLNTLRGFGYVDGKTLFVFPYDWRRSNHETAATFAAFVAGTLGDKPFDIVAHSMGGIVARLYIADHGGSERVARLVTMGTPHRGSIKVLRLADSGWSWWENAMAGGVGQIRATLLTFPSVYELLPSYQDCCAVREPNGHAIPGKFDPLSESFWNKLDLIPDAFGTPEGRKHMAKALDGAARVQARMKQPMPTSVKFVALVTGLIETEWRAFLDESGRKLVGWDTSFGDGTVYEQSAANMRLFDARPSDVEHQRIFDSKSARQVLRWALLSDVEPTAGRSDEQYRGTLDVGGDGIEVSYIGLSVTPELARAGTTVALSLRILGKKALGETDFPVSIKLVGPAGPTELQVVSTVKQGDDFSTERIFRATFKAPEADGVYTVEARLPGMEALEEILRVVP